MEGPGCCCFLGQATCLGAVYSKPVYQEYIDSLEMIDDWIK